MGPGMKFYCMHVASFMHDQSLMLWMDTSINYKQAYVVYYSFFSFFVRSPWLFASFMGNKIGKRRLAVDEKYTRPQGLYQHKDIDHKKLRKLILDSKLAPCYPGDEEFAMDLEECPICFLVWTLPVLFLVSAFGIIYFKDL